MRDTYSIIELGNGISEAFLFFPSDGSNWHSEAIFCLIFSIWLTLVDCFCYSMEEGKLQNVAVLQQFQTILDLRTGKYRKVKE